MEATAEERLCSPAEYLENERRSDVKSEYIAGSVLAMAGASRRNNQITFNIAAELGSQLKNRPCAAYVNDMRVKVSETGMYAYPDLSATCEPLEFEDTHSDTLLNPSLIIEVLSDSTEAYDRGEKFAHYRKLDSLKEYVLVAQDKMRFEHYARQGEKWLLTEFSRKDDLVRLESIGCELPLKEIYDKV